MSQVISLHSFRRATGRSGLVANLAALLALQGKRAGVVDADFHSPGVHFLFGLNDRQIKHSLNDYLWGKCKIQECTYDVTRRLPGKIPGQIILAPASTRVNEIARALRQGYDVGRLSDGFSDLITALKLDFLLVDMRPGIDEETLLTMALSDIQFLLMRPDQQDYQGTAVAVDVARRLGVPRMYLVINKVPEALDFIELKAHAERVYQCKVAAVLPHSDDLMLLASRSIFALEYPDHPLTAQYRQIAALLG
jgi:MinD-like ATPase involved in chromosome partitioning or flagellar assembly